MQENNIDLRKNKLSLKEIVALEYSKCATDPVHFMKKYCKIQHPKRGRINFHLYPFQEQVLEDFKSHQNNIILKSRQLGISTLCAAFALWKMIFQKDYNVLVIATTQETAKNLVTKVKVMYEDLPSWLKPGNKPEENNKLSLRLGNGSQIRAVSSNENSARSIAASLLILDEFAFVQSDKEIWTASQQTLSTGGNCIILSTPNGTGNLFYKLWNDAEENGTMNTIRLRWDVHPDRDQAWRDKQTKELGEKEAAQECDCDYVTSGHTVIDGSILKWYEDTYVEDPIEKRGQAQDFWLWEYPDSTKNYIVCSDVARGDGSDYSAFHIIDIETITQVGEFKSKIGTRDFGRMLVAVATEFNHALLSVENSNIGWDTVQEVIDLGYTNLYYSMKQPNYVDEHLHIFKGYDLMDKSELVPGFTMSQKTRPLTISRMQTYFLENSVIIRSKRTINELNTFIWNGQRAEARSGYNDDLVMALAQGLWLRDTSLKLRTMGIELTRKALENIYKPIQKYEPNQSNAWNMKVGTKNESLKWLL